jgi:hypothetical protein
MPWMPNPIVAIWMRSFGGTFCDAGGVCAPNIFGTDAVTPVTAAILRKSRREGRISPSVCIRRLSRGFQIDPDG